MNQKEFSLLPTMGYLVVFSLGAAADNAAAASSDTATPVAGMLEEVIVTAEKREASAQRTPAQVTAISGDVITEQGVHNIQAMAVFAPNLQLSAEASNTQVFIRGIGQNFDAASDDPASAIYIDQVYTPRQATTGSMFDVERLEVLPGPQGTLYGRNAAGGAVNIITKVPTDVRSIEAMLELGNFADRHLFGAVNIPLSDTLKFRVAVDGHQHDGYLSSGQNDLKALAGRLGVLLTPNDALSVLLRGEYTHNNSKGDGVVDQPAINPGDPWYAPVAPGSSYYSLRTISKLNVELNYKVGDYTLTYIPAYTYFNVRDYEPLGSPVNYFPDPNAPGTLTGFYANLYRAGDRQKQITNELRLAKEANRYHWVAGLYQLHSNTYTSGAEFQIPGGPPPYYIRANDGPYTVRNDSYAVFGEGTFNLTERLRGTVGGRLSHDHKTGDGAPSFFIASAPSCPPSCAVPFTADDKWTNVDWKLGVQMDVAEYSMLYASVQTGYIEGGFSTVPNAGTTNSFNPEKLLAFTAGSKNRFLDNRLQINDEIFYYDYKDLQVTAVNLTSGASIFYNAPKSRIYGNDLDIKYLLTNATEIGINLGLLHARFVEATLPPATVYTCGPGIPPTVPCNVGNGPVTPSSINYAGLELSNAPPVSGTAYLTHRWSLSGGGSLSGRLSTHYEAAHWALYSHLKGLEKDAYYKTDATLTFESPSGKLSAAIWGKNLENTANFVTHATSNVYGLNPAYIEPPRTYGIRLTVNFQE